MAFLFGGGNNNYSAPAPTQQANQDIATASSIAADATRKRAAAAMGRQSTILSGPSTSPTSPGTSAPTKTLLGQ